MEKYIAIRDMSRYPSYANVNARLVYLHVACNVDVSTYDYSHSYRRLAMDVGLSVQQVRTAVKMLVADGLVTTHLSTRQITQGITHLSTQQLTHLHIVRITEIDTQADTQANTPANTPANTLANTPANTQKNNINKTNRQEGHTHARARELLLSKKDKIIEALGVTDGEAAAYIEAFVKRQELKRKAWTDEADMLAHCVSWCEKRLPRPRQPQRPRKGEERTDHDARMAERQRQKEQQQALTEDEERQQRAIDMNRAWNDFMDSGQQQWADEVARDLSKIGYKPVRRRRKEAAP